MISNQNEMEEVEGRGKGEHSYYKQKDIVFCRVEEDCQDWVSSGLTRGSRVRVLEWR